MRNMLGQIGPKAILLWFSKNDLTDDHWNTGPQPLRVDPLFISRAMIDQLRPLVLDVVEVKPSAVALQQGSKGMYFSAMQAKAASEMMGVASHSEASHILLPALRRHLQ